jgi:prepilin signal peptidase PulO-like enzyme (type II secretory pathway)
MMLGKILPGHLLGRLYFLFAIVIFELLFCFEDRGTPPSHMQMYGMNSSMYGQIPIFAYVVFLGLGHFRLKAIREVIPFSPILFICHLVCIAAVFSITVAARLGLGWLSFDPYSYVKSTIYVMGTILLALACVPLRSWMVAIHATGRLWLYASLAGVAGWWFSSPVKLLWGATMTAQSGMMQTATLHA